MMDILEYLEERIEARDPGVFLGPEYAKQIVLELRESRRLALLTWDHLIQEGKVSVHA